MIVKTQSYHVAEADCASALEADVLSYTRCGWRLHGGVALVVLSTGQLWYAQALVFECEEFKET